ncbi:glycoside hydrolase family 17 protein [Xylona heveae TC161]|uniref:glucan endo-1,3-beta-D-glucosidase n=1 Tax=Xylona heveae (strain CBS 132557 / TC161) TaxID=1328760 RepID=A0A165H7D5_XYLHT|nr:glycoside hydrolase family 17 protein [Xylona heveae TC161]KZF23084.1 glycoside hydrolase family 17 protein [Xylona heveae TC161]
MSLNTYRRHNFDDKSGSEDFSHFGNRGEEQIDYATHGNRDRQGPERGYNDSPLPILTNPPRDRSSSPPLPPTHQTYPTVPLSNPYNLSARASNHSASLGLPPGLARNTNYTSQFQSDIPPPPPPHRSGRPVSNIASDVTDLPKLARGLSYSNSTRSKWTITPGMDNLGEGAPGGGINGVAIGVANSHQRESGLQALRAMESDSSLGRHGPAERYDHGGFADEDHFTSALPPDRPDYNMQRMSYSSADPLQANMPPPALSTPPRKPVGSGISPGMYVDDLYGQSPEVWDPRSRRSDPSALDPNDIADDGDDGFMTPQPAKRSMLGQDRRFSKGPSQTTTAAAGAGAGAGVIGTVSGLLGQNGTRSQSQQYGIVPGNAEEMRRDPEKSEWLNQETSGNKRLKWIVGILLALIIIGAIVGGVVGGILGRKHNSSSSSSSSSGDKDTSEDLSLTSSEIQKLLNNQNLHKVFPGMDYTPLNAQYPGCLTNRPSQNNVTRDVAVLSQLTNAIRLYGTDCNQTEMVLHAFDRLNLNKTMKIWLGVWQDNNATTNERQLSQMYDVLDKYGSDPFAGLIVGNEVLFRKDMTATQLGSVLDDVRSNLTSKHISDLPLATSDLGDNWTSDLVPKVDIVMANVHPFFAGVTAAAAAGWTWEFWTGHDVALTQGLTGKKNVISEVGWPSAGGNDCGESTCQTSTDGSVAGIDELNTFMDSWVCQSLTNGTEYFWFEAFDEPWKAIYNTKTEKWEDKWGLMDANRNLKSGVTIPDCNGKTVD